MFALSAHINRQASPLSLLLADACSFELVYAEAFALFLFALLANNGGFYVVHLLAVSFALTFYAVVFLCAFSVAWSHFFCACTAVM